MIPRMIQKRISPVYFILFLNTKEEETNNELWIESENGFTLWSKKKEWSPLIRFIPDETLFYCSATKSTIRMTYMLLI